MAATDLHGPLGAEQWLSAALEALRKGWGDQTLRALLDTGPASLLRGEGT